MCQDWAGKDLSEERDFGLSLECYVHVHKVDRGGHICRGCGMFSVEVGNALMSS